MDIKTRLLAQGLSGVLPTGGVLVDMGEGEVFALADTGNTLNINMSLPIMADLPPVTPGMLIGVREG